MNKQRTQIKPGQKIDLALNEAERQHILDDLTCLDRHLEEIVRKTVSGQPIQMTLDDLDQLSGYVAADANHTKNKKLGKALDRIFGKITVLLDKYTDDPSPKTLKIEDARKDKMIADQAVFIAEWTGHVLAFAEQWKIKTKVVDTFVPGKLERTVLSTLHTVTPKARTKMSKGGTEFTAIEVCGMAMAVAEDLPAATPQEQMGLIMVATTLMDSLQQWIADVGEAKLRKKTTGKSVYQFKITLIESKPPIWRRIQVQDCTLDELHEHIQTAMGWTNSHLHQFEIDKKRYGDPELLEDMGTEIEASTTTWLSEILPSDGKRFRFKYEYDFGDSWQHEVVFEGSLKAVKGTKLPICLEGERACPPEDVGGIHGYENMLEAIGDPKHEEHEHMVQWIGGKFDPQKFDPIKTTKAMKKGLPDWRDEEDDDF